MKKGILFIGVVFTGLTSIASSCTKNSDISSAEQENNPSESIDFIHGVDLSYVNQVQDHGGVYKVLGEEADPYAALKSKGVNMVRLRLWHNPEWVRDVYGEGTTIYSGFEDVATSIQRAKNNNLAVNLDFHYSDIWADPQHQEPPSAWENITDIDVLCDSVYNYTYHVLSTLYTRNLLPEMVQIGNETNCGMMHTKTKPGFPNLLVCDGNWQNMGKVLNAGIRAVREVDKISGKKTIVALHIADPKNLDWWFTNVINQGGVTDFDVAGFSYYHIWHTTVGFDQLSTVVSNLKSKINKDVVILETAYPFTTLNNDSYNNIYGTQDPVPGYPYTVEGQREFMIDLTQNMINAGAIGVMYWEPAWISSQMKDLWGLGSAWENCSFFDFLGNLTDAADYLNYPYENIK
ncbi:arabinogalactan endo-1,4-beta-galactosidase [Labilibacter sediminis]|nr:arabinogalactan endo-1,4-beta-galactosidase [Labilibacter sediminis]